MATRNLTEPFILMRNNALQSKHIYAEQHLSDRVALVESDVDLKGIRLDAPPIWYEALEETQYILGRLKIKLDHLEELHAKQLTRPTLDDTSQEERQMEQLTREIGRAFSNGHRQVQAIKTTARHEKKHIERQLATNAVMALSSVLQELGLRYRTAQTHYLQQVKLREERSSQFFTEDQSFLSNTTNDTWLSESIYNGTDDFGASNEYGRESVLLQIEDEEDRIKSAQEREQQIGIIVQSIADLKYIFKDLAEMVQDQGTVLDRIDYNIEQTQVQVSEGYKQLKKADAYQRANRKMYCIVVLASAIILLSFLLIVFKT